MRVVVVTPILVVVACASQGPETATTEAASGVRIDRAGCEDTGPGVWDDGFVPQQAGRFSASFALASEDPAGSAVDAVAGFADGPAGGFGDLGAIVRLAPDGFVDVRNGGAYQRDAALDYTLYGYDPYVWIRMDVDVPSHTYSVWANHDGQDDTVQIANGYAFRSEQAEVTRVDTMDRYVDAATGAVRLCDLRITPEQCTTSYTQQPAWASTAFPAQSGAFRVEVDAFEAGPRIDAVIGLAADAPQAFTDLGPIVRFNSGGLIDARDGDTYAADAAIQYREWDNYRIAFDVDVPTHTYSVTVTGPGGQPITLASGYRFRTEQAEVTSLAAIGQYVDQLDDPSSWFPNPMIDVCAPTIMY